MTLIDNISLHLAGMAPHIKERLTARLLIEALAEIKRLQNQDCPHCGENCDLRTEAENGTD